MKKKVALLLVLAMVMSILPMNVFGQPNTGASFVTQLVGVTTNNQVRLLPLHLALNDFLPQDFGLVGPGENAGETWWAADLRVNLYGAHPDYVRFPSNTGVPSLDAIDPTPNRGDFMAGFSNVNPHRVHFTRSTPERGQSFASGSPLRWQSLSLEQMTETPLAEIPFEQPIVLSSTGAAVTASALTALSGALNPSLNPPINIMGRVNQPAFFPQSVGVNAPITVNWATEQFARFTVYVLLRNGQTAADVFGNPVQGHLTFQLPVVTRDDNGNNAAIRIGMGGWLVDDNQLGRVILDRPIVARIAAPGVNITYHQDGRVPFHSALALREVRVQERVHDDIRGRSETFENIQAPMQLRLINSPFTSWGAIQDAANTAIADGVQGPFIGNLAWYRTDVVPHERVATGPDVHAIDFGSSFAGAWETTWLRSGGFDTPLNVHWDANVVPRRPLDVAGSGLFTVRLEAPVFYSWALNASGFPVDASGERSLMVTSQFRTFMGIATDAQLNRQRVLRPDLDSNDVRENRLPVIIENRWERTNNRGVALTNQERQNTPVDQLVHALYISLERTGVENGNRRFVGQPDRVNINGLWLLPEDRASNIGDVDVVASHGFSGITNWHNTGGGTNAPEVMEPGGGRTRTLQVGERTTTDLAISIAATNPRTVVSGMLGGLNNDNPNNFNAPHHRGQHTSTILLQEQTPGSWGTGLANPTTFEFRDENGNVHPGVRILGARVRVANSNTAYRATQAEPTDAQRDNRITRDLEASDLAHFRGWASALEGTFPVAQGVANLSPDRLTVWIPSRHVNEVHLNRTLEVRLYVSIEPGYEHLYGNDLVVTVDGSAAANLPAADRQLVVANVIDPISVSLPEGVTPVETGLTHRASHTPVSDIVVHYNNNTLLTIGNEIWFYVVDDIFGPGSELNLNADLRAVVDPDSGLQLGQGRRIQAPGSPNFGALAFPVTRQPNAGSNPVITLTNVTVQGELFADVDYRLVVSGTAVAQNEQNVAEATWATLTPDMRTNLSRHNVGIFTSRPYATTIAQYAGGGMNDAPPVTELPAPAPSAPASTEIRLQLGMAPIDTVVNPFRWGTNAAGQRVGEVSARAFAYLIGGTAEWSDAAGTATLVGVNNTTGQTVTVVLTRGTNLATVNGVTTDIATGADFLSGPAGSIVMTPDADGRVFLPLRFLANAYGFSTTGGGEHEPVILR